MSPVEAERVARTVWPWREAGVAPDPRAAAARIRRRAVIQAVVMAVAACVVALALHHRTAGGIMLGLAALALLSGLLAQPAFLALERFGLRVGRVAAVGMTWLLLVPFYYLCFVPGRIVMRLAGQDPLDRRFPAGRATSWVPHPPAAADRYRKQY